MRLQHQIHTASQTNDFDMRLHAWDNKLPMYFAFNKTNYVRYARPFGMRHLLCACVFVPLRFCPILLPKAEAKTIDFSDCRSNLTINIKRGEKNEKRMINHAHTYQGKLYF